MTTLEKLLVYFEKFPGIGARQARRFVFHLLTLPEAELNELSKLIASLPRDLRECESCARFCSQTVGHGALCALCAEDGRDRTKLMVVASDSDIISVERSGLYDGLYFVLGGTVPLLHAEENKKLRGGRLKALVESRLPDGLGEIILAFAVNPDGENTARYVESLLSPLLSAGGVKLSHLGRGLSTGSELEYADPETIKSALKNRS
jgi:recombination protein RecR